MSLVNSDHRNPSVRRSAGCAHLFVLLLLAGCSSGDGGPATELVSGTVTYQGEPAAEVMLTFLANGEGVDAMAFTNDEGAFDVSTYFDVGKQKKPGMVAGEYSVTAVKLDKAAIKSTMSPPRDLLPKKYRSPDTSLLTATVTSGEENRFEFNLE